MKMIKALQLLVFCFVTITSFGCEEPGIPSKASTPPATDQPPITKRGSILFIGNSLTYSNDLPKLVADMARKRGILLTIKTITAANTAISDHWESGKVHKAMEEKAYDFVVIQQGPSSQSDGRIMLLEYGAKYKELCTTHGSQLAFFMVWPARSNYATFEGVIKNYSDAATENESLLCPVGKEWKEYMDRTNDFSYYGSDQFHPSKKGSEVAAFIILATLYP